MTLRRIYVATTALMLGAASGAPKQVAVTCGVSSSVLLASPPTTFVLVKVPHGTNAVWFDLSGNLAVPAPPSFRIEPGGSETWMVNGSARLEQVSCVAATSTRVTVIYR